MQQRKPRWPSGYPNNSTADISDRVRMEVSILPDLRPIFHHLPKPLRNWFVNGHYWLLRARID
jgi:hypothetical protein